MIKKSKTYIKKQREIIKLMEANYSNSEICDFMNKIYGYNRNAISNFIKNMNEHKINTSNLPARKEKLCVNDKKCYFCQTDVGIEEHHLSYNPQITVNLCKSCHEKIHFLTKNQHILIKEKDAKIKNIFLALNQLNNSVSKTFYTESLSKISDSEKWLEKCTSYELKDEPKNDIKANHFGLPTKTLKEQLDKLNEVRDDNHI